MLAKFERYPLTFGPTHIEKLERLSRHLGGKVELYAKREDCKPYAIPAGASVHKYGGLGYVGFAEEVRAQEKQLGFAFDYIVVCTVTGSTHAGMLVGFAKDGRERKVIGIDASFTPAQTKAQVLDIARNTADLVELGQEIVEDDVVLVEDYAYPAYGVPSEETKG